MTVHSILPLSVAGEVDVGLGATGIDHVAHGDGDHLAAAAAVIDDPYARAVIGPFRSRAVAEVVELTAPVRLPLFAPVATWAGVTRSDEPGCEDHPARHRGTVFRLVARDTVVAQEITDRLRRERLRAFVVAGAHDYGEQLDAQLAYVGLPRASSAEDADIVVLAGLCGAPENERVRELAPLPVVAFDGIQGEEFPCQPVELAVVYAPGQLGAAEVRRAAELVAVTVELTELRKLGPFDENGDLLDAPIRFVRYEP